MLLLIALIVIVYLVRKAKYENSVYYQETQTPYRTVRTDIGVKGEYQAISALEDVVDQKARFLFNLYTPTKNGETTEIDAVIILPQGVMVVEIKNYSGWIFGNASQRHWYQTLPSRYGCKKNSFYNPIRQNGTHILSLRQILGNDVPFCSVVVFSDRCTFKGVSAIGSNTFVVYASDFPELVHKLQTTEAAVLGDQKIVEIYQKLYPYAHASEQVKARHHQYVRQKQLQ